MYVTMYHAVHYHVMEYLSPKYQAKRHCIYFVLNIFTVFDPDLSLKI
jgi:hypothetical protein